MATEKQIQANRKNASKSTGPTSAIGKMISSRNSTRHGFYATNVVLPNEDWEEFIRLAKRLAVAHAPSDTLEEDQVLIIIETNWQLRRANLVDTELFQMFGFYENEDRGPGTAFAQDAAQANTFSKLTRYQSFLLRKRQAAEKELARLKSIHSRHQTAASLEVTADIACSKIPRSAASSESTSGDISPEKVLKRLKQCDQPSSTPHQE